MKIKPEHYAVMEKAITESMTETPWLDTEYQAAGFSPKLLRWDVLTTRAGISVGDSIGMPCREGMDPSLFLPLYDYADDAHIDTALRAIFSKAGFEYGALNSADDAKPLAITNGKQFTPSGNMLAEIVHCDHKTEAQTKSTCLVTLNGQVLANGIIDQIRSCPGELSVIDITGEEHQASVENGFEIRLADPQRFAVRHSCYTLTSYDLVTNANDIAEGHGPEREDGSWESAAFSFDEIQGEACNSSLSEYDAVSLYSTDPSGTREHYEQGVDRFHYLQVEAVNGQVPSLEMVAALGEALELTPSPDLVPKAKPAKLMGM